MDDLKIDIMSDEYLNGTDYIQLKMENLPKIIGRFFTSKKFLVPKDEKDIEETIDFIYANSREEVMELSDIIIGYSNYLKSRNEKVKNINELILAGYLDEIYSLLETMNLVYQEETKVYKK